MTARRPFRNLPATGHVATSPASRWRSWGEFCDSHGSYYRSRRGVVSGLTWKGGHPVVSSTTHRWRASCWVFRVPVRTTRLGVNRPSHPRFHCPIERGVGRTRSVSILQIFGHAQAASRSVIPVRRPRHLPNRPSRRAHGHPGRAHLGSTSRIESSTSTSRMSAPVHADTPSYRAMRGVPRNAGSAVIGGRPPSRPMPASFICTETSGTKPSVTNAAVLATSIAVFEDL